MAVRIVTDEVGTILDVSPDAADLLKVSGDYLRGRNLLLFFVADRPTFYAMAINAASAAAGSSAPRKYTKVQPRNRRRVPVQVVITTLTRGESGVELEWWLSPVPAERCSEDPIASDDMAMLNP